MADTSQAETPQQKYDAALKKLEDLKAVRETLSGKANRKKRTLYNKKIKAVEEKLEELKAATSRDSELEFQIKKWEEEKSNLAGSANKKKRAALNKKISKAQAELENLKNPGTVGANDDYEPPIPDDWMSDKRVPKSIIDALKQKGAKFVCNDVNGLYLKKEIGVSNGKQRAQILTCIQELKTSLDWLPPLENPIDVQTITKGDECTYPKKGDTLFVLYRGTLRRNPEMVFDESKDRSNPFSFKVGLGGVIRGWEEGLPKLSLLEKARLTIRNDYGYGPRQMSMIPPYSDLIFEVELVGIERNGVLLEPGHARHEAEKKRLAERARIKAEKEAQKEAELAKEKEEETAEQGSGEEKEGEEEEVETVETKHEEEVQSADQTEV